MGSRPVRAALLTRTGSTYFPILASRAHRFIFPPDETSVAAVSADPMKAQGCRPLARGGRGNADKEAAGLLGCRPWSPSEAGIAMKRPEPHKNGPCEKSQPIQPLDTPANG